MKSISGSIADTLWTQGIIQKEDIDKCKYGLTGLISAILEISSILIIASIVGNFFETALYFATFIPLRLYAGGYHADTKLKCYLLSLGVYGIFTVIMNVLPKDLYVIVNLFMLVFSLVTILLVAPVIHKNKTVNDIEKKYYRKFSIWICTAETTIILLLTAIFPKSPYIVSLAIGQAAVTVSMISAIIKGKKTDNN